MRYLLTALLVFSILLPCTAMTAEVLDTDPSRYVDRSGESLGYVPNRFVVVLKDNVPVDHARDMQATIALSAKAGFNELAQRFQVQQIIPQFIGSDRNAAANTIEGRKMARHYKVYVDSENIEAAVKAYEANPLVDHVERISIHPLYATPNDPYYVDPPGGYAYDQWHYWDTYGIEADMAWDKETGSNTVLVGDLDIGLKWDHGDIGGSDPPGPDDPVTNGNVWVNTNEVAGNGVDDDGNGYIDDVIGWDFVESTDWYSYPCIDLDCGGADNDPWDGDGHGTHTAGTIAAITNNGYAVAGVAGGWGDGTYSGGGNGVKIVPCRVGYVLDYWIYGATGVVIMDYVAEAMYYMADLKIAGWNVAAINCSFGNTNDGGLGAAADYLLAQDVMIIVAAGNSGANDPSYLGTRTDCLDVGATDQSGNPASFSNYGTWIEVAAPGVDVLSTITDPADPTSDYVAPMDGTSMSCPHVVGVAALLESYVPSLTGPEKFAIISDPANMKSYNQTKYVGAGIIDARKCLDAAQQCDLVADFTADLPTGCAPLGVQFYDASTGTSIDGWSWDFGDGVGTSTAQNPFYTYNNPGTYTVTLTVSSSSQGCNDTETKVDFITVTTVPAADFSGSPTSGAEPLTVNFTDLSTDAISWEWDFGDGVGTSTEQNPSYTYNNQGTYTVTLTASNNCGSDVEQKVDYITVDPCVAPIADFSGTPTTGVAPLTVDFTDASTGATSWDWDFGDGAGTSTMQNPSYTYNDPGCYTVALTATNACGSDIETKIDYICVDSTPPVVKAYANADIQVTGTVSGDFTNTFSSDNVYETISEVEYTGHPRKRYSYLEHKWTVNVGTGGDNMTFYVESYRPNNADGDDFVFAYSTDDATYYDMFAVANATEQVYFYNMPAGLTGTVYIRVLDTDRSWENTSLDPIYIDEMYIQYGSEPGPPVADFVADPTSGVAPLLVQFTDLSAGNPDGWSWDFGDGLGTSNDQNPAYTYDNAGTYTVTLTASNAYGSDDEIKVDYIQVSPPGQSMHVSDITVTRKTAGPNCAGQCYVTIVDGAGAPVANATVYTLATGPVGGSFSGVTDGSGVAFMETGKTKSCSGEWCFEVTDVTHAIYTYNQTDNVVTKACESGPVYRAVARVPEGYALWQNNPNPFNPTTQITFNLPSGSYVKLEVFNIVGQRVAVLADGIFSAGQYSVTWDASDVSAGIYLYRLTTEFGIETKKMTLLK